MTDLPFPPSNLGVTTPIATGFPPAQGLYDPTTERDACGVGVVATTSGESCREVIDKALEALGVLWHRGAVDADGKTGDGAGIHLQVPQAFFRDHVRASGLNPPASPLAVGMIFLPRVDLNAQERCRSIVETAIIAAGFTIYGWRQVPINASVIGDKADSSRPEIEQIIIAEKDDQKAACSETVNRRLYVVRRAIEKAVAAAQIANFYICSFSSQSIIYKGLFLAEQLAEFYPDLLDSRFISNFAIYHQRYSTNTFPNWPLAQPFRVLAHNGEINTVQGNVRWMRVHESRFASPLFAPEDMTVLSGLISNESSDSAALDAAFEIMAQTAHPLPEVQAMFVPEAWEQNKSLSPELKAFYSWAASLVEPWDGPAALIGYANNWLVSAMDRNGLRPLRYSITKNGLLLLGSETGMTRIDEAEIVRKGHLGPGERLGIDLAAGKLYLNGDLQDYIGSLHDYSKRLQSRQSPPKPAETGAQLSVDLRRTLQRLAGWTIEDMELILAPMLLEGKEATGSMGDDSPLAVISEAYRPLHHYFRQNFAQVTNPPIDSLRERYVMSLVTRLGNGANILNPGNKRLDYIELPSPVLLNASFQALIEAQGKKTATIDLTLQADENLRAGMNRLLKEAEEAVRAGRTFLVLADTEIRRQRVAIPPILATSAVHNHLIREGLRSYASINVRAADCLDVHYFAVLLGVGATTINPWLVQETIAERQERGLLGGLSFEEGLHRYASAIDSGILKVMSKMGISVLTSYRGGYNFEALGLSRALVSAYFPGLPSRLSGLGIEGLEKRLRRHNHAVWGIKTNAKGGTRGADGQASKTALSVGGYYRYRQGKEPHGWDPKSIHLLQRAIHVDSFHLYKEYLKGLATLPPIHLRDLLGFVDQTPIDIEDVESVTEIRKRMVAPGISLGALSPEAHETLAVAMNRIGARSDSGEGGEDPLRYTPRANGDNASSAIKQVASGRFGVTAEYLNNCSEIEIKIAQGAKPGEGGQLPGFKVSSLIAKLRYSTEGVTLISPPPHHDIYSIEDLAQLIYDLKQINPFARVCVKLVAKNGIGTVAAGVAKAHADVILVSGHSGGTGASPQSSIKYAGLPWEMGLAEVNQVLTLNGLRDKVRLRTDGGLKTGRDLVIAAMLGADEYGIGTASLVAMGCILVRQCHSNTCPVGICTQREGLRHHFKGHPDDVIRLFSFIADEVRTILAELGYRKLGDVIGRTDLLQQISRGSPELDDLDLNPLLVKVGQHGDRGKESKESTPQLYADLPEVTGRYSTGAPHPVPDSLDVAMIRDAAALFKSREKMELDYRVVNTHRTVGARISSEITRHFGMNELDEGYLTVRLRGSAGQSLGAWAVQGLTLKVRGDANDYVGKGLSGGTIIIAPPRMSTLKTPQNTIVGNTVLYGAVRGKLYAAGRAGERFAVRNSGADAVVEGCGANGCEYMTGGRVVILGKVGANFGAGMTGGMAWIYDPSDHFASMVNPQTLTWQRMEVPHWVDQCRRLVERHHHETRSKWAEQILLEWHKESAHFWQVIPKETVSKLHAPLLLSDLQANSAA